MSKEIEIKDTGTEIMPRPPATNMALKWLDDEISIGKLLESYKVARGPGDDLVGQLWQAFAVKVQHLKTTLEAKRDRAERDFQQAKKENKIADATAESAYRLAYTTALSELRMQFGTMLDA